MTTCSGRHACVDLWGDSRLFWPYPVKEALSPNGHAPASPLNIAKKMQECASSKFAIDYQDIRICLEARKILCEFEVSVPQTGNTVQAHADCMDAYKSMTCQQYLLSLKFGQPAACHPPSGQMKPGEQCQFSSQCSSERCGFDGNCGTCARISGIGYPCGWTPDCDPWLICDELTHVCISKKNEGEDCSQNFECKYGSICQENRCREIISIKLDQAQLWQPCDEKTPCELGAAICNKAGICVPFRVSIPGEFCGESTTAFVRCGALGTCENSVCTPRTSGIRLCPAEIKCESGVCSDDVCYGDEKPRLGCD